MMPSHNRLDNRASPHNAHTQRHTDIQYILILIIPIENTSSRSPKRVPTLDLSENGPMVQRQPHNNRYYYRIN